MIFGPETDDFLWVDGDPGLFVDFCDLARAMETKVPQNKCLY
jgi:hypothetical protein